METSTTAVRPVKVKDLINEPGYEEMLVVPSKVVPTVKAPDARKKARIVLCGNLVEDTSKRHEQTMSTCSAEAHGKLLRPIRQWHQRNVSEVYLAEGGPREMGHRGH